MASAGAADALLCAPDALLCTSGPAGAAGFDPASSSFAYVYLLLQQLRFRTD